MRETIVIQEELKFLVQLVHHSSGDEEQLQVPLDVLKQYLNGKDGPIILAAHGRNETLLHAVCAHKKATLEAVQWLVGLYPGAVRHQAGRGTPLHEACCNDYIDVEIVQYLGTLFPGALKLVNHESGFTPLACALCRTKTPISLELVTLLVRMDPEAVRIKIAGNNLNCGETTVIHYGCQQETVTVELLKVLVEYWPECISIRARGLLLFHSLFSERSHSRPTPKGLIGFLLSRYPDAIQEMAFDGDWCGLPLHMACKKGEPLDIIQFIGDAYPPAYNNQLSGDSFSAGNTPLHEYLRGNPKVDLDVVCHLVHKFPESVGILNSSGCLPHQYAILAGFEVIQYLIEKNSAAARDQRFFDNIMIRADLETMQYILPLFPEGMTANSGLFGTMLHRACRINDHPNIRERLEYIYNLCPESIKIPNAHGDLPLHIACKAFDGGMTVDGIEFLLSKFPGAARVQNNQGMMCLHLLYQNFDQVRSVGEPDAINLAAKLLVTAYSGALLVIDEEGRLPIHHACNSRHSLETIKQLVDLCPASVRVLSYKHGLPIHRLAQASNDVDTLQYLIRQSKDTLDTHVVGMGLPLHCASRVGQKDSVSLLMTCRYPDLLDEGLPLHALLRDNELLDKATIVEHFLSEYRWPLSATDSQGATPLHIAVASDVGANTIQKLVDLNPDLVQIKDKAGFLPLHYALQGGDPSEVVEMLLDAYPEAVKVAGADNSLPIHIACQKGAPVLTVKRLVSLFPGSVGKLDRGQELPLHKACRSGHWKIVEYLAEQDPSSLRFANQEGKLPAFLLSQSCGKESWAPDELMELGTIFAILRLHPEAIL